LASSGRRLSVNAGKCWSHFPARRPDDNKKPKGLNWEYQIAAGNAGWPVQFRFAVHGFLSRVPELWTLGILKFMKLYPLTPDAWGAVAFRCLLFVSLTLLLAQFWAETQTWYIRLQMQESPRLFTVLLGLVLFLSSVFVVRRHRFLGLFGFVVGGLSMLLILLPEYAGN
jgi:hypothetical protein